jgi:hypothetical protein
MAGEADQNPLVVTEPAAGDNKSDSGMESDITTTSSSTTVAAIKMVNNQIPEITNYWKKSHVSEANRHAYHDFDWLTGNLISSIHEVDVPTTHDSTVVCFESYMVSGLGLSCCYHELPWVRAGALQSKCHRCPQLLQDVV